MIAALLESGAAGGLNANPEQEPFLVRLSAPGRQELALKITELAERADVPVATVRHYLREGLLPGAGQDLAQHGLLPAGVRRPDPADQAAPGGAVHAAEGDPRPARARQRRARAAAGDDRARGPDPRARPRPASASGVPADEVESATRSRARCSNASPSSASSRPTADGYSPSDVRIVEAISRFRAGGYDETIGFTVYDTLRYKQALEPLVAEEVRLLTERLAGDVDPDRAIEIDRGRRGAAQRPARRRCTPSCWSPSSRRASRARLSRLLALDVAGASPAGARSTISPRPATSAATDAAGSVASS